MHIAFSESMYAAPFVCLATSPVEKYLSVVEFTFRIVLKVFVFFGGLIFFQPVNH